MLPIFRRKYDDDTAKTGRTFRFSSSSGDMHSPSCSRSIARASGNSSASTSPPASPHLTITVHPWDCQPHNPRPCHPHCTAKGRRKKQKSSPEGEGSQKRATSSSGMNVLARTGLVVSVSVSVSVSGRAEQKHTDVFCSLCLSSLPLLWSIRLILVPKPPHVPSPAEVTSVFAMSSTSTEVSQQQ